jgi:hypothetical protein
MEDQIVPLFLFISVAIIANAVAIFLDIPPFKGRDVLQGVDLTEAVHKVERGSISLLPHCVVPIFANLRK